MVEKILKKIDLKIESIEFGEEIVEFLNEIKVEFVSLEKSTNNEIEELEGEIDDLKEEVGDLKDDVREQEDEKIALENEIEDLKDSTIITKTLEDDLKLIILKRLFRFSIQDLDVIVKEVEKNINFKEKWIKSEFHSHV